MISWTVTRFNYGRLPTTCRGLVRPIPIYRWNLWNKESFLVFLFLTAFILSPRPWQTDTVPQSGWPVLVASVPWMSYSLLPWRIWTVEQSFRNQVCKFSTSSAVLCLHRIFFLCVGVHWTFVWVNPFSVIWCTSLIIGTASFKVKIPNGNMRVSAQLDELGDVVMRQVADKLDIPKER